jgi:MFS family permease
MSSVAQSTTRAIGWRTPLVLTICACLIAMIGFGPRSSLGFFLQPISGANGWGREVFAVGIAVQNLLWGVGQPVAGGLADRFGSVRVICVGAILYAAGLVMMVYSTTPAMFDLSSGVLIGFGLSGCSFPLVIGAVGKLVPDNWRATAFGAGTAAGSFGQFLFSPLALWLTDLFGWRVALLAFAGLLMLVIPLSLSLAAPRGAMRSQGPSSMPSQSFRQALAEAFGHRSYVLLVLGFFTCGFQLAFITVHLPAYLIDRGLDAATGAMTIAVIGLFNIVGSLIAGWLASRMPMRYILSVIYFARALMVVFFITMPPSVASTLIFGAVTGLLWLSTVPPTSGLVVTMFGTRWLAMLFGFAFFSHQVGGFLGVLLGGIVFEYTGSYNLVWWLSVMFGVLSAIINLPIIEKPVVRVAPAAA